MVLVLSGEPIVLDFAGYLICFGVAMVLLFVIWFIKSGGGESQ
jgi:hypothetical protein